MDASSANLFHLCAYNPLWLDIDDVIEDEADKSQNSILAHTDILPIIFGFLPDTTAVRQVCRQWRAVAFDKMETRLGAIMERWCREELRHRRYRSPIPPICLAYRDYFLQCCPKIQPIVESSMTFFQTLPGITEHERLKFVKIFLSFRTRRELNTAVERTRFQFSHPSNRDMEHFTESSAALCGSFLLRWKTDEKLAELMRDTEFSESKRNTISCICIRRMLRGQSFKKATSFLNLCDPWDALDWLAIDWCATLFYKKYLGVTKERYEEIEASIPAAERIPFVTRVSAKLNLADFLNQGLFSQAEALIRENPSEYNPLKGIIEWVQHKRLEFPEGKNLFDQLDEHQQLVGALSALTRAYFLHNDRENGIRCLREMDSHAQEALAILGAIHQIMHPEDKDSPLPYVVKGLLDLATGRTSLDQLVHLGEDYSDLDGMGSIRFVYKV